MTKNLVKLSIASAFFGVCTLANTASASQAIGTTIPYFGVKAGPSFVYVDGDDQDTVFSVNPYVGLKTKITDTFATRLELEAFIHTDYKDKYDDYYYSAKAEFSTYGMFVSGYMDFNTYTPLSLYVGAGIGFASHDVEIRESFLGQYYYFDDSTTNLATHVDLGTKIDCGAGINLDVGVRYAYYGSLLEDNNFEDIDATSFDILAGIEYNF